jgi:hypothetical protein
MHRNRWRRAAATPAFSKPRRIFSEFIQESSPEAVAGLNR